METEKVSLDITKAQKTLLDQGAVKTTIAFIQESDTDPYYCRCVLRGEDANGKQLPEQTLCPPPCNISKAFNPNA